VVRRPAGQDPGRHYAGSIVIDHCKARSGRLEYVEIRTDDLTLKPIVDDAKTIQFYQTALYGDPVVMRRFADGIVRGREVVERRVRSLADRWRNHDCYSAFVISHALTGECLGHTLFGHGDSKGETEYALLLKRYFADGSPLWNRGIGRQVIYAMFTGWAPWLAAAGIPVVNDADGKAYPLDTLTATVRKDNLAHRLFDRLLVDDPTNVKRTFDSTKWGAERTHFFTTPEAMRSLRRQLLGGAF